MALPLILLSACSDGGRAATDGAPVNDGAPGSDGSTADADPEQARSYYYYWGDFESDGVYRVALVDHDGGMTGVLALDELGGAQIAQVAVAPAGTAIAVAGRDQASSEIVLNLYPPEGGAATTLVTGSRGDEQIAQIAFSPDGSRVAFRGDFNSPGESSLYVVPADASAGPTRVSPALADGQDVEGFFWADDTRLVFTGDVVVDQVTGVYVVDVAASSPSSVPLIPQDSLEAGQEVRRTHGADAAGRVYFTSTHELTPRRLYRVGLNGQGLEQVPGTAIDEGEIGAFGLSPAGDALAFSSLAPDADSEVVYVLDLDKAAAVPVSAITPTTGSGDGALREAAPIRFSRDGSKLAAAASFQLAAGEAGFAVWLFPAAAPAGGARLLAPAAVGGAVTAVAFTPDGARLVAFGDLTSDNDAELYELTDLATTDQDPTAARVQDVPEGGDILGLAVAP